MKTYKAWQAFTPSMQPKCWRVTVYAPGAIHVVVPQEFSSEQAANAWIKEQTKETK